jgi:hypothetical protein
VLLLIVEIQGLHIGLVPTQHDDGVGLHAPFTALRARDLAPQPQTQIFNVVALLIKGDTAAN